VKFKEPIDGPQRLGRRLRTVDVSLADEMERAPAISMIAKATRLLSAMPIQVSTPIRSKAAGACSGALVSFSRRGCSR
jgi:hypothetical protein